MANNEDLILAALAQAGNAAKKVPEAVADWLEENVDPETGYVLDSSLTVEGAAADAKAAGDKLGEIKSAFVNITTPSKLGNYGWTSYSIYDDDGHLIAATDSCTSVYMLGDGNYKTITAGTGYQSKVALYNSSKVFQKIIVPIGEGTKEFNIPSGWYYRIQVKLPGGTLSPSDITDSVFVGYTDLPTDKTLSNSGKPADAKVTGDGMQNIKNSIDYFLDNGEYLYLPDIERGGINTSGVNNDDAVASKIRTKDYIPTTAIDIVKVLVSGFSFNYYYYNYENGQYVYKTRGSKNIDYTIDKTYGYIRLYIYKSPSIAVTDWGTYIRTVKIGEYFKDVNSDIANLNQSVFPVKTKNIAYTLLDRGLSTNGHLAGETTYAKTVSLTNVSEGDRFIFTLNEGYILRTVFNDAVSTGLSQYYNIDQRKAYIVASSTNMHGSLLNIAILKCDASAFTDQDDIGLTIEKVIWNSHEGIYDCIVASADASDEDKARADFVCDGINDEIELECAVNYNATIGNTANVLLLGGTFYVDNFHQHYIQPGTVGRGKVAICVMLSRIPAQALSGYYYPYVVRIDGKNQYSTRIRVSQTVYETISSSDKESEYAVIGAIRQSNTDYMGAYTLALRLFCNDITVQNYLPEKPICMIDGCGFTVLCCERIRVDIWGVRIPLLTYDRYTFPDGSIGIRMVHGSNSGIEATIRSCVIIGYKEGLALLGEHLLIEDTAMLRCYYGFTIGNYPTEPKMEHPIVMIGCGVEKAYRFALLNRYGTTEESYNTSANNMQTLVYIGGSSEPDWTDANNVVHPTLPILEVVKNTYRGTFETDYQSTQKLFEEDSGLQLKKRNYSRAVVGVLTASDEYPYRSPSNQMDDDAEFVDKDTNALYRMINGSWKTIYSET